MAVEPLVDTEKPDNGFFVDARIHGIVSRPMAR